ncbi:hypothetical protein [Kluyvera genomosp. 3]|uniref:Uncharacterized protein n=1 Tax=Kluyvera genomosp. 3 TaxID=2774055 RepID=A0A6G9RLL5_9ENTR|nr:hypothetical protein [Kluyvera genomosp. 3]QIR27722.1 hypothetical protein GY169_13320 [Kluyvera genomosp. 3]
MAKQGLWLEMHERIEKKIKPETLILSEKIKQRNNYLLNREFKSRAEPIFLTKEEEMKWLEDVIEYNEDVLNYNLSRQAKQKEKKVRLKRCSYQPRLDSNGNYIPKGIYYKDGTYEISIQYKREKNRVYGHGSLEEAEQALI